MKYNEQKIDESVRQVMKNHEHRSDRDFILRMKEKKESNMIDIHIKAYVDIAAKMYNLNATQRALKILFLKQEIYLNIF